MGGGLLFQSINESLPNSFSQFISHQVITLPTASTSHIHTNYAPYKTQPIFQLLLSVNIAMPSILQYITKLHFIKLICYFVFAFCVHCMSLFDYMLTMVDIQLQPSLFHIWLATSNMATWFMISSTIIILSINIYLLWFFGYSNYYYI